MILSLSPKKKYLRFSEINQSLLFVFVQKHFFHFYFELEMVFRKPYLLSSILSNSEVWYGTTKAEIEQLEQVDECLMREFF